MTDINRIKKKFTETYDNFKWKYGNGESRSGEGSSLYWTENYRTELSKILDDYKISKILDCSCGDWNWMKDLSHKLIDYTGVDIVDSLIKKNNEIYSSDKIKFVCNDMLNFLENTKESYDLVICRHTFEHLPDEYVINTLNTIVKKTKFCLFSSQDVIQNVDINFDGYRSRNINLRLNPYKELLGDPIYFFNDSPIGETNNLEYQKVFGFLYKIK